MAHISKKRKAATEIYEHAKTYPLDEALGILEKFPKARFDETVELSLHLGVDPRQSTQMVRGVVNLPKGSGKKVRVIAFTDNAQVALDAGADTAGMDDLLSKIQEGWTDFDVAVATPAAMKEVRKVARVLGPRGLMPNPKSGTVTDDLPAAIQSLKSGGRVEFKMDKTANMGVVVGKRSFPAADIKENISAVLDAVGKARPDAMKGHGYIKSAAVSGTMTPGVRLESAVFSNL
jgi:large subunit ribosomal protein L1